MKIYVLEEYNTGRVACISEDINMIRKKMCDKTYFDPQYNDYPILTIWENGDSIEKIEGGNVLKKIAEEINFSYFHIFEIQNSCFIQTEKHRLCFAQATSIVAPSELYLPEPFPAL